MSVYVRVSVCVCVCVFEQVNTWTKPPIGQHLVQAALRSEPFADAAYLPRHDALLLALHHRRQRASRGMWATPLTVCPSLPSMSGVGAQGLTGTAAYNHGRGCLNRLVPRKPFGPGRLLDVYFGMPGKGISLPIHRTSLGQLRILYCGAVVAGLVLQF